MEYILSSVHLFQDFNLVQIRRFYRYFSVYNGQLEGLFPHFSFKNLFSLFFSFLPMALSITASSIFLNQYQFSTLRNTTGFDYLIYIYGFFVGFIVLNLFSFRFLPSILMTHLMAMKKTPIKLQQCFLNNNYHHINPILQNHLSVEEIKRECEEYSGFQIFDRTPTFLEKLKGGKELHGALTDILDKSLPKKISERVYSMATANIFFETEAGIAIIRTIEAKELKKVFADSNITKVKAL